MAEIARGPQVPESPRVSVIIPAWRPTLLEGALASVRAQTWRDFELIVVDDGSPEPVAPSETADLVLVRQANAGPAAARNTGVAVARGELVAFLDADDQWRPAKLARQVDLHDRRPEVVLSTTDTLGADPSGAKQWRLRERHAFTGELVPFRVLFHENCIATSAAMARRDALLAAGGFDEQRRLAEDYALWLRLGVRGAVGYVDEVLVDYLTNPAGLTATGQDGGRWHLNEIEVYEVFLAEHPELRREAYVADALARVWFDAGYGALQRGDRRAAREALARSLGYRRWRPKTWLNLARACAPGSPTKGA